MSDDVVHIDGVTKRFGKVTALDKMDIKIKRGEFVTFLGPSGCGKSTTLRILGGFERPDSGTVYLSGQDVTRLPPNRRKVNMVFQDYALFPHMTVRQNVAFGLELKGMGRAAIDARITEILSFLELMPLIDRFPDQISGGQRQRAALARALAPDPELLLLDEPLGALDARLRAQVQIELKSIQRSTGKTFFFVTHDQDEALTMSDRIVVMNGGKIEQDGTPEDLYLRPQTRFVAEFIGETNMLQGQMGDMSGGIGQIEWQGQPLTGVAKKGAPGQSVHASIRLERVQISTGKPAHDNAVSGRLTNSLFKGNRRMFEVKTPGATLLATAPENDTTTFVPGSEVWLGWNRDDMIILAD